MVEPIGKSDAVKKETSIWDMIHAGNGEEETD